MKSGRVTCSLLLSCLLFLSCSHSSFEPDDQFVAFYFKYGFKNELNTFESTYQKDLVLDGVVRVPFWLTDEEQNSILQKAEAIDYFSLPDTFRYVSPNDSIVASIDPNPGPQVLRIKYQSLDKTTTWTYPLNDDDAQAKDLMELRSYIIFVIEAKPEYKKLPPARGGYL